MRKTLWAPLVVIAGAVALAAIAFAAPQSPATTW